MSTEDRTEADAGTRGIEGFFVETRNYGATAAFWASLGFTAAFETGHGSGHWAHPAGGPYVFIVEQHDRPLGACPVITVPDADAFSPSRPPEYLQPFQPEHWGVLGAVLADPDGRPVALQAPLPPGTGAQAAHEGV